MAEFRYRRFRRPFDPRWRFMTGFQDPRRILDLGCGAGGNCTDFRRLYPHAELSGVDLFDRGPDGIDYRRVDLNAGELPFDDASFDIITMTHVIEHLDHPCRIGAAIHRVLKPDGGFYVETPNWTSTLVPSFGFCREQSGPFNFYDDPTHVRPWSKHGLFEFLREQCHLRVEAVGTRRNWAYVPLDALRLPLAVIRRRRGDAISAFSNIYGWSIFAIGTAPTSGRNAWSRRTLAPPPT
jgi:SAM-dependent methyltransferase